MKLLYLLIFALFSAVTIAQKKIPISNKSFEDMPRRGDNVIGFHMAGWYDCGVLRFPAESAPDVHPGKFWDNDTQPADGQSYIGMVVRDNESWEGISQRLQTPIITGKCYQFTIDLARSPKYMSAKRLTNVPHNYIEPAVFRIWGGSGMCNDRELLAESKAIDHPDWRTYQFKIKPKADHKFILIEAFYKTPILVPYCGHILVDNLSDFDEMDCNATLPPVVIKKDIVSTTSTKEKLPPHKKNRVEQNRKIETTQEQQPIVKEEPKKILEDLDIKKINVGTTVNIKTLNFKADTSTIDKSSYPVLDELYGFLKENKSVKLEIGGHTNGLPSHEYCDKLSSSRAKAVYDYLVAKGIDPSRLSYKGYGKRKRIASDTSVDGRNKNQRVEVKIISLS
jgi:outer membrane protein OmpA-like peptidoglycan-associated protein